MSWPMGYRGPPVTCWHWPGRRNWKKDLAVKVRMEEGCMGCKEEGCMEEGGVQGVTEDEADNPGLELTGGNGEGG